MCKYRDYYSGPSGDPNPVSPNPIHGCVILSDKNSCQDHSLTCRQVNCIYSTFTGQWYKSLFPKDPNSSNVYSNQMKLAETPQPCCCSRWLRPDSHGWGLIWSIRKSTWSTPLWPGSMSATLCVASQASPCLTWRTPSQSAGAPSWTQCEWLLCRFTLQSSHTSTPIPQHTPTVIYTMHTYISHTYHICVCVKSFLCVCICNQIIQFFFFSVTYT